MSKIKVEIAPSYMVKGEVKITMPYEVAQALYTMYNDVGYSKTSEESQLWTALYDAGMRSWSTT